MVMIRGRSQNGAECSNQLKKNLSKQIPAIEEHNYFSYFFILNVSKRKHKYIIICINSVVESVRR